MEHIVFVNGTFDVLHTGHLNLLEHASRLGGLLIVALDSDDRVRKLKGPGRPINCLEDRIRMLKAWNLADSIVSFDSDQELFDIIYGASSSTSWLTMVKGDDYIDKSFIGQEYCDNVIYVPRNEKSTSYIISG